MQYIKLVLSNQCSFAFKLSSDIVEMTRGEKVRRVDSGIEPCFPTQNHKWRPGSVTTQPQLCTRPVFYGEYYPIGDIGALWKLLASGEGWDVMEGNH
jgi:hypothetical protein